MACRPAPLAAHLRALQKPQALCLPLSFSLPSPRLNSQPTHMLAIARCDSPRLPPKSHHLLASANPVRTRTSPRPTFEPLPLPPVPQSMHQLQADQSPSSPYANMDVPYFDRRESLDVLAMREAEFRSLSENIAVEGLVVRQREQDKAYVQKAKGLAPTAGGGGQPKSVALLRFPFLAPS